MCDELSLEVDEKRSAYLTYRPTCYLAADLRCSFAQQFICLLEDLIMIAVSVKVKGGCKTMATPYHFLQINTVLVLGKNK